MITGLMPLAALNWLPGGRPGSQARGGPVAGSRGAFRLPLVFAACTVAAGVIDSFLPLARGVPTSISSAALLVQAVTATISRWQAGRHGDRYGHVRLLIPAIVVSALGMAGMFGLFSARTGYPAAFALTGAVMLAALPAALRERKASVKPPPNVSGSSSTTPCPIGDQASPTRPPSPSTSTPKRARRRSTVVTPDRT